MRKLTMVHILATLFSEETYYILPQAHARNFIVTPIHSVITHLFISKSQLPASSHHLHLEKSN